MTATDGAPALPGTDAAAPVAGGQPGIADQRGPWLRTVLGVAKVEGSLLVRSVLVLAGLLAGGVLIWIFIYPSVPMWWNAAWQIGQGQLALAMAVLMAAQLAAGRARRDGLSDLYASFPATGGTRILGHLAGLAGTMSAGLVLIGASVVAVRLLGAVGSPSIMVLAGGLLLVIASGAVGIAIGIRFPHPLVGVLGALALFLISSQSTRFSDAIMWLLPWEFMQDQMGSLPGPLPGYPPAGAHLAFRPLTQTTPVPAWATPAGHLLLAAPVLAATCWAELAIMNHTIPRHTLGPAPAVYPLIAQLIGWCAAMLAVAACVDRSRYADLGGAIAAPVTFTAILVAWYLPVTARVLVEPLATARGVTVAWYIVASVAVALTCVAMRDRWHRYTRRGRSRS